MRKKRLKIFFSGIAGSGVSAIACFMRNKGHDVVGSDRVFDRGLGQSLREEFQSMGIEIVPQDGSGIDGFPGLAVFSTAVEKGHPELLRARRLKVPIKKRPEYLVEIASSYNTIAVSGTSGKSTTSGLLAFLMQRLGLKPNFIGGGRVRQFRSKSNLGNHLVGNSDHLVVEACESDGTITQYRPLHTIILNLALDHQPVNETAKMFKKLMRNTRKNTFLNADDKNLMGVFNRDEAITFSIYNPSHYRADRIVYRPFSTEFFLKNIRFGLSLPGEHNLYNALSCIALLSASGIPLEDIADVLNEFKGLYRRFDVHLNTRKGFVIDDYAHNPHKILHLMKTLSRLKKHICYIFQPHGFAPTRFMKDEYIRVFTENLRDSDHLIILSIYYAGGTVSRDISSHDLFKGIKAAGKSVEVLEDRREIFGILHKWQNYVIFGARDDSLSLLAEDIASSLRS